MNWIWREHLLQARFVGRWLVLGALVALPVGSACALFLWSLDLVTRWRLDHPWMLWFLPLAGVLIALLYRYLGRSVEGGNNLIMDQIHEPGGGVPTRMAPLILVTTLLTHLFGGSAGREGTAVQMGGSLASGIGRALRLSPQTQRLLLISGIAAGFGAVFGTPLAGAIFAMEVLTIGSMSYESLLPGLIAALLADQVCSAWGITHTHYQITSGHGLLQWGLAAKILLASAAFGLASVVFARSVQGISRLFNRWIPWFYLRPLVGGLLILLLARLWGSDYLGLGVWSNDPHAVTIRSCFQVGGAGTWSWLWKLLLTALTLGCGFKGGEVTPLFFIGAALGHQLALWMGMPVDLLAGLGFVAVFAGATNTPLACTMMGVELFGSGPLIYLAMACYVSYLFSGHQGIYKAQRLGRAKGESRAERT